MKNLSEQELEELLQKSPTSTIWKQRIGPKEISHDIPILLGFIIPFIVFFAFILSGKLVVDWDSTFPKENLIIIGITIIPFLIIRFQYIRMSKSIKYYISPINIRFEWGFIWKENVSIPFHKITAINLVNYEDKAYSLYFLVQIKNIILSGWTLIRDNLELILLSKGSRKEKKFIVYYIIYGNEGKKFMPRELHKLISIKILIDLLRVNA